MAAVHARPEFDGWHIWKGAALWYASRRSSPPRVVSARHRRHLRGKVVTAAQPDYWDRALAARAEATAELTERIGGQWRFDQPLPL